MPETSSLVTPLKTSPSSCDEPSSWFALSATFGRELKAKTYLESKQVRCFIPMRYALVSDKSGSKTRRQVPAISNLLFAYTTRNRLQELKQGVDYLQYLTRPSEGRNIPITVPEREMMAFITVCETLDERLTYLRPDEVDLAAGTRVRIVGGAFDGIEGTLLKVDRRRKRRVVLCIQGLAAVALAEVTNGYIEVLK